MSRATTHRAGPAARLAPQLRQVWAAAPTATTLRQDVMTLGLALWLVSGVFVDGWAHTNRPKLETFFTPWHGLLYSGALAVFAWFAWLAGTARAVPAGYRPGLIAAPLFLLGGGLDLLWHSIFGLEVSLDALLSPTHLLLFSSGLLVASSPWQAGAGRRAAGLSGRARSRVSAVEYGSLVVTTLLTAFFLMYTSAFGFPFATVVVTAVPEGQPGHLESQLPAVAGLGGYLLTTILLVVPLLLVLRRGTPPRGGACVLIVLVATASAALTDFLQPWVPLAALLCGVIVDWLMVISRQWSPRRSALVVSMAVPGVLWPAQLLGAATSSSLGWSAELLAGAVLLCVATAAAVAAFATPGPAEAA